MKEHEDHAGSSERERPRPLAQEGPPGRAELFGPLLMMQAPERLDPHNTSVCDRISAGMSRGDVVELVAARHLRRDKKPRADNPWWIEEEGFRCAISFDAGNGTVVKKNKTVVTDQKRPTAHCAS